MNTTAYGKETLTSQRNATQRNKQTHDTNTQHGKLKQHLSIMVKANRSYIPIRYTFLHILIRLPASISGDEVCYVPYGCFNSDPPFQRSFVKLPKSPQVVGTKFMLYTQAQSANPDIITDGDPASVRTSTFDGKKSTFFVVHGYLGTFYFFKYLVSCSSGLSISFLISLCVEQRG